MIGKNMTKSTLRIGKMNEKILQKISILSVFLIAGCAGFDYFGAGNTYSDSTSTTVTELQPVATVSPSATDVPYVEPDPVEPVIVPPTEDNNDFVNYRETAANYREFGERTPRDQRIVTASAGSNMSAAIPPTIEEEVMDYEEEVNAALEDAEGSGENTNQNSGGDDPVEDWLAEEGSTLKGLLSDWSERAGWRLIWNTNRNYTLAAGAMFRGRFADVSSALIRTFARARPAPIATFYKGNRVLVVETMEDENAYN